MHEEPRNKNLILDAVIYAIWEKMKIEIMETFNNFMHV